MRAELFASDFRHWPGRRSKRARAGRFFLVLLESLTVTLMAMALALLGSVTFARASGEPAPTQLALVTPGDMHSGALLLKSTDEGRYVEAPRVATDADISVSGPTLRARITQIFHNPTKGWVEGVYVYPLPDGAAIDTLKMVIGKRVVVGDIKKREEARVIYEQAKAEGKKASLVEEERPNMFTNSVANIGPGETVVVQIEYQEPVRQADGKFSLRLPLVVAPRYHPLSEVQQTVDFKPGIGGWGEAAEAGQPAGAFKDPPVLDPRVNAPVNPVSITVRLQAGFDLGEVTSSFHPVKVEAPTPQSRLVTLAEGVVPADKDFELVWQPAATKAPSVGLFTEKVDGGDYLLAFVTPPPLTQGDAAPRPREVTFVIDNSGSMSGTSMSQAKASLVYALSRLKPSDRFNVIRFDDTMDKLFDDTVPADEDHLAKAHSFVGALEARGGTEMIPPMKAALTDPRPGDQAYVRQVVFLTDGGISNEQELFSTITSMRGRSRVFMVGIGSAPNSFLMTRAAELGRGTFTQVGTVDQVKERMQTLFDKLENPVVTGLSATFSAAQADATPAILPDIYRGEPLVLAAKLDTLKGSVEIRGMVGERPWSVTLPLDKAAPGQGLSKLWARRKIDDAEVAQMMQTITQDEADKRILALALQHHLVTRLTSLVAVDKAPSRPADAVLTRADVPLNLPAGWDFDKVFGPGESRPALERKAQDDTTIRLASAELKAIASQAKPVPVANGPKNVVLPQTATDAELKLWLGFGLLVLALGFGLGGRLSRSQA